MTNNAGVESHQSHHGVNHVRVSIRGVCRSLFLCLNTIPLRVAVMELWDSCLFVLVPRSLEGKTPPTTSYYPAPAVASPTKLHHLT